MEWEDDDKPAKAALYLDGAHPANRADWPRQHKWLAETLRKFVDVFGPRLSTPDNPSFNSKKMRLAFWTRFNAQLLDAGSSIEMPTPKPKGRVDVPLGKGVSLWMAVQTEENWIGGGLQFSGKAGQAAYEHAIKHANALKLHPATTVEPEEDESDTYLSVYRLALFGDAKRIPEYVTWLHQLAEKSKELYALHLTGAGAVVA